MDWWIYLIITLVMLVCFLISGMPVAVAFMLFNIIGTIFWVGGLNGLKNVAANGFSNLSSFALLPIPMFIFLGEVMFQSGLATMMIDSVEKWIGRIRGSLSMIAVIGGAIFATMSGSAASGVAVLGATLYPEMRARNYSTEMSIGPILGAGPLAVIIPPTAIGVLLATLAGLSVGKFLLAAIFPGFLLVFIYAIYIFVRANLQPHLVPDPAFMPHITWGHRIKSALTVTPMALIIFLVIGLIFLGITTPSEAAAAGALGAILLSLCYGKLNLGMMRRSIEETIKVTCMVLFIILGSQIFSQILAFTGITRGVVSLIIEAGLSPYVIMIFVQLILIFLGCFVDAISIIMICVPIFMPIVASMGLDPIWFCVIFLVNIELGGITPPFGLTIFIMKGVCGESTSINDIYKAGFPFLLMGLFCIALLILFPQISLWLPSLMVR